MNIIAGVCTLIVVLGLLIEVLFPTKKPALLAGRQSQALPPARTVTELRQLCKQRGLKASRWSKKQCLQALYKP